MKQPSASGTLFFNSEDTAAQVNQHAMQIPGGASKFLTFNITGKTFAGADSNLQLIATTASDGWINWREITDAANTHPTMFSRYESAVWSASTSAAFRGGGGNPNWDTGGADLARDTAGWQLAANRPWSLTGQIALTASHTSIHTRLSFQGSGGHNFRTWTNVFSTKVIGPLTNFGLKVKSPGVNAAFNGSITYM
jgi:hypothetical protein